MLLKLILSIVLIFAHFIVAINSSVATDAQFPSMIALIDLKMRFVTSGNLITSSHVLSIAEAYSAGRTLMALAGDVSLSRTLKRSRQLRSIVRISIHPLYEEALNEDFNIAIALMNKPFDLSLYIHPIDLCTEHLKEQEACFSVGWNLQQKEKFTFSSQSLIPFSDRFHYLNNMNVPLKHNILNYQEVRVVPGRECNVTGVTSICVRTDENTTLLNNAGNQLICSENLCGMAMGTIGDGQALNSSLNLFANLKRVGAWIEQELSPVVFSEKFLKRSDGTKLLSFSIWLLIAIIIK